jgi:hypothetical protein
MIKPHDLFFAIGLVVLTALIVLLVLLGAALFGGLCKKGKEVPIE